MVEGHGWRPRLVSGDEPEPVHQALAAALDETLDAIAGQGRPPMIVLRTPKGWTGPREVDGVPVEDTWRAHQVPLPNVRGNPEHLRQLEDWMRSYRPEELFDERGAPVPDLLAEAPRGDRRMSGNPHTNGGLLTRDLSLPDFRDYAVEVQKPGAGSTEATRVLGAFLRDVIARNPENFRL